MNRLAPVVVPILLLGGAFGLPAQAPAANTITLSVRDADWKDVLRAAMQSRQGRVHAS